MIQPPPTSPGDAASTRSLAVHWALAVVSSTTGVLAGVLAMKLFPKAASALSSSPGIAATVIWPVLAVIALASGAQHAVGTLSRNLRLCAGYLFVGVSAMTLTLAITGPWSGIAMSGQHLTEKTPPPR